MAEALGILSSLVACYEAISPILKFAGQLYRAPREVEAFTEQLQAFQCTIQTVSGVNPLESAAFASALTAAKTASDEISKFVAANFNPEHMSPNAYRTSWIRNRRQFARYQKMLRRSRKRVEKAVLVDIYISVQQQAAILMLDSEGRLEPSSVNRRTRAHSLKLSSRQHVDNLGSNGFSLPNASAHATLESSPAQYSACEDAIRRSEPRISSSAAATTLSVRSGKESVIVARTSPTSRFEMLPSFHPEVYTNKANMHTLFSYLIQEVYTDEFYRKSECALFYLSGPRRWIRVSATIMTTRQSKYWGAMKAGTTIPTALGNYSLPTSLNAQVERYLAARGAEVMQDCHLEIALRDPVIETGQPLNRITEIRLEQPSLVTEVRQLLENATEQITHSGVAWYDEAELDMRTFHHQSKKLGNFFLAWLHYRWVLACRFGTYEAHLRQHLYHLKLLSALRGSTGVSTLLGFFSHSPGTGLISGFLWELPTGGRLDRALLHDASSKENHAMQRRLRWCRDLIQGLANIHHRQFTVGSMMAEKSGVGINNEDRAIFNSRFSDTFEVYEGRLGILPPEHKTLVVGERRYRATYRTDLYHLGFLLWRIIENEIMGASCIVASCATPAGTACTRSHPEVSQLPWIDRSVPLYMRHIISICRSSDPLNRLPAYQLLDRLPQSFEDDLEERTPRLSHLTRLEDCYALWGPHPACDRCGAFTMRHYFHCSLCEDYDVCKKCFDAGRHCLDLGHWLREKFDGLNEDRYWSTPDSVGERKLMSL